MVFYVFLLNLKKKEDFLEAYQAGWNGHWKYENKKFENFLLQDPNLKSLSHHMFLVWDGNHRL